MWYYIVIALQQIKNGGINLNKEKFKGILIGVVVMSLLFFGANSTMAQSITKSITVAFNKMNIVVNGTKVNADNILYNGTTYVPLRAISEMLGKYVTWDSKTNTAIISDNEVVDKSNELSSMDFSQLHHDKGYFEKSNGIASMFTNGTVKVRQDSYSLENSIKFSSIYPGSISYVLNGEYKKLTGYYACNDDNKHFTGNPTYDSSIFEIISDESLCLQPVAFRGDKPEYFEIDIEGTDILVFRGGKLVDSNANILRSGGVLLDLKLWK